MNPIAAPSYDRAIAVRSPVAAQPESTSVWASETTSVGLGGHDQREADPAGHRRRRDDRAAPSVSIIVPTFNEIGNIQPLLDGIRSALEDTEFEIIVVDDDSDDGTWQLMVSLVQQDQRLRLIRRTAERGLSSAIIAGMNAALGEVFVVLDADLQHDEQKIPKLVSAVRDGVWMSVSAPVRTTVETTDCSVAGVGWFPGPAPPQPVYYSTCPSAIQ